MSNPYSAFCEDFYINMRLGSQMALPHARETVLHFFERIQRQYPSMARFRRTDGETSLEEERDREGYRWLSLENRRVSSGHVNPPSISQAMAFHQLVLEMAPHHLGLSPLEVDYVDVLFGFDLVFGGNHDEIVAETMLRESPLNCLADEPGARAIDFQPSVTVALSDDCRLQARIDVITRTNSYQVRTGDYSDDTISVYLVMRRYWGDRPQVTFDAMIGHLAERAEAVCHNLVIPRILRPMAEAIGSRS